MSEALSSLRRRWWLYAGLGAGLLLGLWALLAPAWPAASGWRWLAQAGLAFAYPLWVLGRHLGLNYRAEEDPAALLPDLGPGNWASLVRGALLAALAGFVGLALPGWPDWQVWRAWLPGLLYTLAAGLDALDGALARRANRLTRLGEELDMRLDGLGMLLATTLAVQYGQVPAWFILIGLARYLYLLGIAWRRRRGLPVFDLPYSLLRLMAAGMMMGFAGIVLWPVFRPPGTYLAAYAWAAPFLWGFGRDWLIASGRMRGEGGASLAPLYRLVAGIPAALRLTALLAWGLRWLDAAAPAWLLWAQLPAVVLLFAGVAVRWVGVYLLMSLGLWQHFAPLDWGLQMMMLVYTALIFLGSGRYWTLWQPEERYVHRKRPPA